MAYTLAETESELGIIVIKTASLSSFFLTVAIYLSTQAGSASAAETAVDISPAVDTASQSSIAAKLADDTAPQSSIAANSAQTGSITQIDRPTNPRKFKIALVLGGGGTRGYAHIGALRVFKRENIPFDMIVGTSIGSIVGGLYAAGLTPDEIETHMFKNSFKRSFYTVPIPVRVAAVPIFFIPHLLGYHPYDGLYVGKKFAKYIDKINPSETNKIENLPIQFAAVASNLLDGKPYAVSTGDLGRAIQASSAVPELRRPVPIGDKLFVDGGIEANLPVLQAKELGADFVIAVNVDEQFDAKRREFHKILSVAHRVVNMTLVKVDEDQVKAADIVIQPDVHDIYLLSGKTSDGKKAMKAGESAAEAALPEIRRKIEAAAMAAKP